MRRVHEPHLGRTADRFRAPRLLRGRPSRVAGRAAMHGLWPAPRHHRRGSCPFCTSGSWEWQAVSGKGTIYSYEIVTQAIQPAFAEWVPYPVVLVELDEQRSVTWRWGIEDETVSVRLITNLVQRDDPTRPEDEANVAIGKRVEVCFVDLTDDFALPQFRLSDEAPEHAPWRAG